MATARVVIPGGHDTELVKVWPPKMPDYVKSTPPPEISATVDRQGYFAARAGLLPHIALCTKSLNIGTVKSI